MQGKKAWRSGFSVRIPCVSDLGIVSDFELRDSWSKKAGSKVTRIREECGSLLKFVVWIQDALQAHDST